jgi:hypothetical protein
LDRGGRLDITISALENFDGIVVLRGRGDGTFSSMEFPTGNFINSSFVLGDLNGDPRPEAIVNTGAYGSLLTVFVNISVREDSRAAPGQGEKDLIALPIALSARGSGTLAFEHIILNLTAISRLPVNR